MKIVSAEMGGFQEILERKEAELDQVLRKRDGIAIEKSADQMDEIQYASERELAMRNVDRESTCCVR
jgi:DnaK suppressor protein